MTQFTEEMKEAAVNTPVFLMGTASRNGRPNTVPIKFARIISDDEILLVDNLMYKTRQNIEENPMVAVSFWNPPLSFGFQFKGKAQVATSGEAFDSTLQWLQSNNPSLPLKPKAIVIVKVDEIYYIGKGKDSGINLAQSGEHNSGRGGCEY